jgi:ribA/ribD-fused uncharacterized protein
MDEYIFFWRLSEDNSYLSQWARSPFTTRSGLKFSTTEQYMMYYKALTFNDFSTADMIYDSYEAHPRVHKKLGRQVNGFNFKEWRKVCEDIVLEGNIYKFSQNYTMRKALLDTGNKILVEASPTDAL